MSQQFTKSPEIRPEDSASASGDLLAAVATTRQDTLSTTSSTDGDYQPFKSAANGRLWASALIDTALPAGTNNIGDVDVLTVPAPLSTTGGGTEATALRVTVASDSTGVLSVDDNGGSLTVDGTVGVSGVVDTELPAAAALADAAANPTTPTVGAASLVFNGTTWDRARGDTGNGLDVDVTRLPALVAGTANIGDVDVASIAAGDNNIGNVDIASLPVASTATLANVADSASSVTLLAANAARKGASFWNDSTAILYLKFGSAATSTSCTVKLIADAFYELPGPTVYSGLVSGIWASAPGGACRVTELT